MVWWGSFVNRREVDVWEVQRAWSDAVRCGVNNDVRCRLLHHIGEIVHKLELQVSFLSILASSELT